MRRLFKLALQKPEMAAASLLILLVIVFQIKSDGVFLSYDNLRGVLGFLPEMGLVAMHGDPMPEDWFPVVWEQAIGNRQ